ncbi:hypothetical protein CDG76_17950 [Nostoc sp. 'Peltigera membranacea cyanobiont' 210A]|nr:hypothetical protein CDG76_17950 [Nostoc sp. 'Peltigera membranacea cyanobiont' 210A]
MRQPNSNKFNKIMIFINKLTSFIDKIMIFINKLTSFIDKIMIFINKVMIFALNTELIVILNTNF